MEIVTGYTGTAHVTSADDGALNAAVYGFGNYVLGTATQEPFLEEHTDHSITVYEGEAMMNGRHVRIRKNESESLDITPPGSGLWSVDVVYLKYVKDGSGNESVVLALEQGEARQPSESYSSPAQLPRPEAPGEGNDIASGATLAAFPLYRINYDGTSVYSVVSLFNTASLNSLRGSATIELGNAGNTFTSEKFKCLRLSDHLWMITLDKLYTGLNVGTGNKGEVYIGFNVPVASASHGNVVILANELSVNSSYVADTERDSYWVKTSQQESFSEGLLATTIGIRKTGSASMNSLLVKYKAIVYGELF